MAELDGFRENQPPLPANTPPTTLDGTPGGPVITRAPEIDHESGDQAPAAPAMTNAELEQLPEAQKRTLAQKVSERRFKDTGRAAIYERRDAMPLAERQELEQADPEAAGILEAQAGQARAPIDPNAQAAPAAPQAPAPAPVATNGNRYKLNVYGREEEVSEDQVIQAGIQALQKQGAADQILRDATTYEASLKRWSTDLQAYADNLARTASTPAPAGTPGTAPTTTGVAAKVDPATVRKALDAFANDDADAASLMLQKAVEDAVAARTPAPVAHVPGPTAPQTGEVPRLQRAASDPWSQEQRQRANTVFNSEYASFTDTQYEAAKAALADAMADPANVGQSLETLTRTVCRTTARLVPATTAPPPPPVNPTQENLEGRRVLKARIPVTPPAASGRAPSSAAPEVRYKSPSDYVQELRRRSGSNSTR